MGETWFEQHDVESFGQGVLAAGGRITNGAQGRPQDGEQHMYPLVVVGLGWILLEVAQDEQQPIFGCRQRVCRVWRVAPVLTLWALRHKSE